MMDASTPTAASTIGITTAFTLIHGLDLIKRDHTQGHTLTRIDPT